MAGVMDEVDAYFDDLRGNVRKAKPVVAPALAAPAYIASLLRRLEGRFEPGGSVHTLMHGGYGSVEADAEAALDAAGLVQTGALPFAPKSLGGTLGTVLGRAAKNAPHKALDEAERLYTRGGMDELEPGGRLWRLGNEQIHHATGAYMGVDGKPRWELADPPFVLPRWYGRGRDMDSLEGVYDHPKLYEAYPDMADIKLELSDQPTAGMRGAYDTRYVEPSLKLFMSAINKERNKAEVLNDTLAHELQHGVQDREGFQNGGHPELFRGWALDYQKSALAKVRRQLSETVDEYHDLKKQGEDTASVKDFYSYLLDREHELSKMSEAELQFDAYRHLPGEAEARAVGKRAGKQPVRPAYVDYDVDMRNLLDNYFMNKLRRP